jgi:phosphinothricin acetyltransferase
VRVRDEAHDGFHCCAPRYLPDTSARHVPRMEIRPATAADLRGIEDIYLHYVATSGCTYQLEPEPFEARERWFERHGGKHPVIVAVEGERMLGWASLSVFNARGGYARTVESSVYVHHGAHRRGIGRALMVDLIERADALGHHVIVAGIDAEQEASVALHLSLGFVHAGRLREVGYKMGRLRDVVYMQRTRDA